MIHEKPSQIIASQAPAPIAGAASVEMPRALPFLLNVLIASALGGYLGGWKGAVAGAGAMFILLGGFFLAPGITRLRDTVMGRVRSVCAILRPIVGLLLLPPVALFALVVSLLLYAWERTLGRLNRPALALPFSPVSAFRSVRALLGGLFVAENLPMTAVNGLLLLVLGCVAIGIQVAFYAALAAVPVLICTLVMVAIESSREPDDGPAKG